MIPIRVVSLALMLAAWLGNNFRLGIGKTTLVNHVCSFLFYHINKFIFHTSCISISCSLLNCTNLWIIICNVPFLIDFLSSFFLPHVIVLSSFLNTVSRFSPHVCTSPLMIIYQFYYIFKFSFIYDTHPLLYSS